MRILVFLFCLFLAMPVSAQGFFAGLPDIPLMQGLEEIEDGALSYDKPEGRILVGVARVDDSISEKQVQAYYAESLPEFGWHALGAFSYIRGMEKLEIVVQNSGDEKILEITISP